MVDDYETPSGLVVRDRRHTRAGELTPTTSFDDPRTHEPNVNGAGTGTSVGPTSSTGDGNTLVMYPHDAWHSEAWSGWPVDWSTPLRNTTGPFGLGWGGQMANSGAYIWTKVSTVMNCVDLSSRQLGSFPIYGVKGSDTFQLPEWRDNPEPEAYSGWPDFMHAAVNSLLLRGETILYATGRYADGRIARFATLNPDLVNVEYIGGNRVVSLGDQILDPDDVCITRYQSWPGRVRGISPLEWIGASLNTAGRAEEYASGLLTNGGIPWAVLKTDAKIEKQQATDIQARWVAAAHSRNGAPAVLGGGLDLQAMTISPTDMALLELREFDERRICAAFATPAYLVNVAQAGSMTYSNASTLYDAHWRGTLRPLVGLLMQSWSSWLLPRGSSMEANPDRYTQPALNERVAAYTALFNLVDEQGNRAMTIAEIRNAERLGPPIADDVDANSSVSGQLLTGRAA